MDIKKLEEKRDAAKQAGDRCRSEAIQQLHSLFKIPEGYESNGIRKLVDNVINAAVLKMTEYNAEGAIMYEKDKLSNKGE